MNNRYILSEQEFDKFVSLVVEYHVFQYQTSTNTLLEGNLLTGFKKAVAGIVKNKPKLKQQVANVFSKIKSAGEVPSEFFGDLIDIAKEFPGSLKQLQQLIQQEAGGTVAEVDNQQPLKIKKSVITKVRDFTEKYKNLVRGVAFAAALSVFGTATLGVGNKAATSKVTDLETGNTSLTQPAFKAVKTLDPGKNIMLGGGDVSSIDVDTDDATVKAAQNLGVDISDDAAIQTYGVGDGDMTDAQIDDAAEKAADKYVGGIGDDGLQKLKQGDKVIIKAKAGASDSNQTGADDADEDKADSGGSLLKKRGENSQKILAKLVKILTAKLKAKGINKPIKVDIDDKAQYSDTDSQKVNNNPQDNSADQASYQDLDLGVEDGGNITYIQYYTDQFKAPRLVPGEEPGGEPTDEKPRTGGVDRLVVPTNPEAIGRVVTRFSELNRNGQIATILKIASGGSADAFAALGKEPMTSITDKELGSLQKKEDKKEANLANAILYIRKNPDQFLKQFGPAIGVQLSSRAKAAQIVPGQGPQAPTGIQESASILLREYQQLILEAYIEDYMSNIGKLSATDKVALLAMVGSMYRSSGGELSIIDLGTLGTGYADELRKVGFAQQPQGKGYVFLGPGQSKKDLAKPQPDVAAVGAAITKNQSLKSLLQRIDTQDELTSLVLGIFNTYKPTFTNDTTKVTNALNKLDDRIVTEAEKQSEDVSNILTAIGKDGTLKSKLQNIDNEQEAIEVIISDIIPFIGENLKKDKQKLKQALVNAFNKFRSASQSKPTTTKSGNYTSISTAPGIDINNIKYVKEAKRFQKLAGII
jgi:hypothetical protein